jgi:hypothetical protein
MSSKEDTREKNGARVCPHDLYAALPGRAEPSVHTLILPHPYPSFELTFAWSPQDPRYSMNIEVEWWAPSVQTECL